jgi:putative PEP-CTERM system TPR-repeat lipoprotein
MNTLCKSTMKRKFTKVLVSIAFVSMTITACGKPKDIETLIAEAKQYQQKGDDKAAIIQFKNALQQDPDNQEARYLLGTLYNKTGDPQSAKKELSRAMSLGMEPAKVLPDLGQALLSLGEFQQALDKTDMLPKDANFAEVLTLRGNASLALGKAEDAKDFFEQALKDKPDFPGALIGLARYSLMQRDIESAMRLTEQAVTSHPDNSDAWFFKGDLLRAQGKIDLAKPAYDQVIKLKPDHVAAYINRASMAIGTRNFDAARADLETARRLAPGNLLVIYTQALLDFTEGKHAVALEAVQRVLSAAPNHMPSVLLAGAAQFSLGSLMQAEQHVRRYLRADPNNLYATKLMASILLRNRQATQAIEILTPVLNVIQQDPQLFALAGESYMQIRNFTKATEYFEKANSLAPDNAALHTALAMSKLGQGDRQSAITELEAAVDLDTQSSRAGVLLVMTHLQAREFDSALSAVEELEKEQPDNPVFQNLKGGVYLGKNDLIKARTSFDKALSLQSDYFPAISNLARIDIQENKPDIAKQRFEAVLKKDKKHIQAMNALAGIALSQGKNDEATTWLERASNENPGVLQPALQLGAHYLRINENKKALDLARKLQGTHSDDLNVIELLAQAQLANDDKAAALENYLRLAARLPDSAAAQFRLASIHEAMQNPKAASDALKKALTLKPDYLEAQLALARLEIHNNNLEEAFKISKEIQKQHANLPAGHELEGDLLMRQSKPAQALNAYEKAFSLNQNSQLMIKQHAALNQTGKESQASARLTKWLEEHPSDSATRLYLAGVYLAKKQYDAAIQQYHIILRDHPNHAATLNNLAWAYQQKKDPLALEYAEKAYQQAPDSPAILDTLGWILVEQGDTARALPTLTKSGFSCT